MSYHDGIAFSTKDQDNDHGDPGQCATKHRGAWWYNCCWRSHLTGLYIKGYDLKERGIGWSTWKGFNYFLKNVEMKIRPATT